MLQAQIKEAHFSAICFAFMKQRAIKRMLRRRRKKLNECKVQKLLQQSVSLQREFIQFSTECQVTLTIYIAASRGGSL